ncbi:MAG: peptide chain release factor 3 [Candidatus Omnitrophica bacterium]|nr:peptide chain release factor 3 [Candidatus Omnitrophota bacterium]
MSLSPSEQIKQEASRRRTFAIISHPDAGKTTLTEKLLLYGGALDLAGSVTSKKKQRDTASDWMELEKKRGISISSTVLQFDYENFRLNLLDTPGHKDFSEDTYRVLMAVDAVIMVIDAGKGIEGQTRKLFEICRKRGIPIFTFMNKLDRPSMSPLELIDQLEKVLNIHAFPVNWPLGNGPDFKGIFDRLSHQVHLFERVTAGAYKAPVTVHDLAEPFVKSILHDDIYDTVVEELEMLDIAQDGFDINAVLAGKTTPVFFGSAANNFGVELLLKRFLEYSTAPSPRTTNKGLIPLDHPDFSAFIFKVQSNMNPLHRDRIVFARVCSGRFYRDMKIYHQRSKREIRLSDSFTIFGRDREVMAEAYPGDILGFVTKLDYRIGDTISTDPELLFNEIPRFAPECFGYLHNSEASTYKPFRKGLDHLLAEDIVQTFSMLRNGGSIPLLGAVGPLQFEVLQYRLKDEYGGASRLEVLPFKVLRWVNEPFNEEELKQTQSNEVALAKDNQGRLVILFQSDWSYNYYMRRFPDIKLLDSPLNSKPDNIKK